MFGLIARDALCPKCGSLERHRLSYFYLLSKINLFASKSIKVLHFAPEKSITSIFKMFKNIEYISCDIEPEKAMCVQDITNITFDDNTFDIIFCSHVLEHIEDDSKAMTELFRVLHPQGIAILQVPFGKIHPFDKTELTTTFEDFTITAPEEREKAFGQEDHVRLYEKNDFVKRLKDSGFNVIEEKIMEAFKDEFQIKYGLSADDIIFAVTKQ
ncbi:class I SAM-dependent methyltransferase [Helicobacter didelphidarum]|nr:class I SAM-dependent methyltransferase [Helicobacter didelphidarum]